MLQMLKQQTDGLAHTSGLNFTAVDAGEKQGQLVRRILSWNILAVFPTD
jgi:hypothetical protein